MLNRFKLQVNNNLRASFQITFLINLLITITINLQATLKVSFTTSLRIYRFKASKPHSTHNSRNQPKSLAICAVHRVSTCLTRPRQAPICQIRAFLRPRMYQRHKIQPDKAHKYPKHKSWPISTPFKVEPCKFPDLILKMVQCKDRCLHI